MYFFKCSHYELAFKETKPHPTHCPSREHFMWHFFFCREEEGMAVNLQQGEAAAKSKTTVGDGISISLQLINFKMSGHFPSLFVRTHPGKIKHVL